MFQFKEFPNLEDDEIRLENIIRDEPNSEGNYTYRYGFKVILKKTNEDIGIVFFAPDLSRMQYLRGHISYGIDKAYRGHSYSVKACNLIKQVALAHGFNRLFVGCDFDNTASKRTIEKLGALPITRADVPDDEIINQLQKEKTLMFVWNIEE